ncbi:MAG TPA: hypothetical protein VKG84_04290, partial [Candidatus Acidoferrales bacterium]|nr:hypothetical protein [Candidatus Acidoferrales bacterium]
INQDGQSGNDRPNLVGGQPLGIPHPNRTDQLKEWFNTAAFSKNAITAANPTGNGDAGRNIIYGPSFRDVDLAVFRNFKVYERMVLQVRAEALNVFNFVNLNNPVSSMSASNFGSITGAGTMRQLQLGMRLTF